VFVTDTRRHVTDRLQASREVNENLPRPPAHDWNRDAWHHDVDTRWPRVVSRAVESSRDAGRRPIDSSHHRQNMQSHTRRPWVTRSLRSTATNTLQEP